MSALRGRFFDGKDSRGHDATLIVSGGKVKVVARELEAQFNARGVRRSLRIADTPRWLYLPGGGAFVTPDNDAADRLMRSRRYEALLAKWESRPIYAALALACLAVSLWLLVDRGLPLAAEQIAERIPPSAEADLGRRTLQGMDQFLLQPTALPIQRQRALREGLYEMRDAANETTPISLQFRATRAIGANAFALPGGTIVVTDDLVKLAKRDEEVLAVIAHEIGHVRHRHTMRRLLEGSVTALGIAGITGDLGSAASLAASAPALLLQTKYSRDNEREADAYAAEVLRRAKIDPGYLAVMLGRLEEAYAKKHRGGLPTFLASHPATEERKALALGASGKPFVEPPPAPVAAIVIAKPRPRDALQRQVVDLLEQRRFEELDSLLGGLQQKLERGEGSQLETAFGAFRHLPPEGEPALSEWIAKMPASYPAAAARGIFYLSRGLQARGTAYARETPEENMRAMRAYLGKSRADLERSLKLARNASLSSSNLIWLSQNVDSRDRTRKYYEDAVKVDPQNVNLRLAYLSTLEPRWGGSYGEMEAFVAQTRGALADPRRADRLAARIPAYRGFEAQQAKRFGEALERYSESLKLDEDAGTLCDRSYVLNRLERNKEAFADVKRALEKRPDLDWCLERAAYAAAGVQGNWAEIADLMTLVIEARPDLGQAYAQRGWAYYSLGKPQLAFQDYLACAKQGNPGCEAQLSRAYYNGSGVAMDRDQAYFWARKAAAQDEPGAQAMVDQGKRSRAAARATQR